jgi:hypothetical protein
MFGATEQNILKLFGSLVDGWLLSPPTLPKANQVKENIIY